MISDVVLIGVSKENLKRGFRNFDVDSVDPLTEQKLHSLIKVRLWTREEHSRLNMIKYGAHVVIRGRIENDEEYGLYVVAESIYLCS